MKIDVEIAAESIRRLINTKKEEFIKEYCERSNITREIYDKHFVALPCNCGDESCGGWATILNDPECVKTHLELYGGGG